VRTSWKENGDPDVQDFDKAYFVATLNKTKKGVVQEDIGEPFVQVALASPFTSALLLHH